MKCEEVKKRISELVDDNLTDEEKETVMSHVESCVSCRAELAKTEKLLELLKNFDELDAPAEIIVNVNRMLDEEPLYKKIWGFFTGLDLKRLPLKTIAVTIVAIMVIYLNQKNPATLQNLKETTLEKHYKNMKEETKEEKLYAPLSEDKEAPMDEVTPSLEVEEKEGEVKAGEKITGAEKAKKTLAETKSFKKPSKKKEAAKKPKPKAKPSLKKEPVARTDINGPGDDMAETDIARRIREYPSKAKIKEQMQPAPAGDEKTKEAVKKDEGFYIPTMFDPELTKKRELKEEAVEHAKTEKEEPVKEEAPALKDYAASDEDRNVPLSAVGGVMGTEQRGASSTAAQTEPDTSSALTLKDSPSDIQAGDITKESVAPPEAKAIKPLENAYSPTEPVEAKKQLTFKGMDNFEEEIDTEDDIILEEAEDKLDDDYAYRRSQLTTEPHERKKHEPLSKTKRERITGEKTIPAYDKTFADEPKVEDESAPMAFIPHSAPSRPAPPPSAPMKEQVKAPPVEETMPEAETVLNETGTGARVTRDSRQEEGKLMKIVDESSLKKEIYNNYFVFKVTDKNAKDDLFKSVNENGGHVVWELDTSMSAKVMEDEKARKESIYKVKILLPKKNYDKFIKGLTGNSKFKLVTKAKINIGMTADIKERIDAINKKEPADFLTVEIELTL